MENQKFVIQGQRPDMENRQTEQTEQRILNILSDKSKQVTDPTKNWEHGTDAPVG